MVFQDGHTCASLTKNSGSKLPQPIGARQTDGGTLE